MARIRTIKPEMFDDPELGAVSLAARWLFVGLLTQADRAGRLTDEPRRLKVRLMPFDDYDVAGLLDELATAKFLHRYQIDGKAYLQIRTFERHQRPHPKEPQSVIPAMATAPPARTRRAAKRNGEPRKETASKVDSGSLDTGSLESGSLDSRSLEVGQSVERDPRAASIEATVACQGQRASPLEVWGIFRAAAATAGISLTIDPPSPVKDFSVLQSISDSYKVDDIVRAAEAWWASPHVKFRYLATFAKDIGLVLRHLDSNTPTKFLAPPAAGATSKTSGNIAVLQEWVQHG